MVFKWHGHHTDKFLSLYKSYDFLYDNNNPLYRKKKFREAAYKEIITKMNIPNLTPYDVKCKIKTIRTNYKAKLNKVLRSERNVKDQSEVYVPHVFWFKKADEFLRPVVLRETENGAASLKEDTLYTETDPEENATYHSDIDACDIKLEDTETEEPNENESISPPAETNSVSTISSDLLSFTPGIPPASDWDLPSNFVDDSTKPTCPMETTMQSSLSNDTKRDSNKRAHPLTVLEQSVAKLQKTIEQHKDEGVNDEFDLFGKSIALQLKRMPLERALICQENLQKVMNQERLLHR